MPFDLPKAGSVSALRQAFNNRESQAQTEAQKPATFRSRPVTPVTPRSPAQTRIAAPPRQTPSPPPSRLAEATYGQKTVIASPRPTTPATTASQPLVTVTAIPTTKATPITQQTVLAGPSSVPASASVPSTPLALTPPDVTSQGFGRRVTRTFEWPAGPKTDYAFEHHGHHDQSSLDTLISTSLPANPAQGVRLNNNIKMNLANDKPSSRLKKLSEADSNSPLAKFRRADSKKTVDRNADVSVPRQSATLIATPVEVGKSAVSGTTPLSGPLSIPAPQRQVYDRIAVIEAVAHATISGGSGPTHGTPFFSPSDQAAHMPGAFNDSDSSYFPRQPSPPSQRQASTGDSLNVIIAVPAKTSAGSAPSPTELTTPLLLQPVAVPYFEFLSPLDEHTHDKEHEELTRVEHVLDNIILEHRAALEEIIARLGKELRGMKHQYDEADIPETFKKEFESFASIPEVNKILEDEIKVERHDSVHDHHFPEPHRSIATLAPKIQEQTGILLALMRQIKEVATVWSVDLEQVGCQLVQSCIRQP